MKKVEKIQMLRITWTCGCCGKEVTELTAKDNLLTLEGWEYLHVSQSEKMLVCGKCIASHTKEIVDSFHEVYKNDGRNKTLRLIQSFAHVAYRGM